MIQAITISEPPENWHINLCHHLEGSSTLASIDLCKLKRVKKVPDSKVHGANMGSIWGRQDPGGPPVGPMNFAISGVTGSNSLAVAELNTRPSPNPIMESKSTWRYYQISNM